MRRPFFILLVGVLLSVAAAAQGIPPPARFKIKSQVLHEEREILVRLPRPYSAEGRYPVVYMTDGSNGMAHAISTVEFLVRSGRMPDVIIIGIENTDRTRDLTPTRVLKGSEGVGFDVSTSGGADNFLRFVETELIPEIERKYHPAPYRIFAGHSFGGLSAIHAFLSRPQLFSAYIAASPSLQWDQQAEVKRAKEFLKENKENKDLAKTLFVTIGDEGGPMHKRLINLAAC